MTAKAFTVAEIARLLDAEFQGDGEHKILGIASLDKASSADISFLSNPKLKVQLNTTKAGCVLLSEDARDFASGNSIVVKDPYLGFARVAQLLDSTPVPNAGVHPSAQVSDSAQLGNNVSVGAGCVVEENVIIHDDVILGANTVVAKGAVVGAGSRLYSNVTVYHYVQIGKNCIVQSGAVIGSDGFGYANDKGIWVRIPQTGSVIMGDDVDIGANACIDRGALNDTIIGNGVKIDNLCHIAHNVVIGEHSAMAACSGVAGSTTIGKHCTFSGRSSILGHLSIADGTHVTACSLINRSNKEAGVFSSGTGMQDNKIWRKNVARFRQLDDMAKQLKKLEKELTKLKSES
ncbi:UDP-3-O-(3-hydroxymyristoyl)glucosamine N-acyltransferase [Aliikangiella sp. IMCC44359]|uniref:UDP-3-O-(3-hydroxymyristoyl)glucosamine N-acyltransferase n=1 Tax=Aliikangiella sp. IMCC44359 TaxID=3459125 RepID=UPI00403AF654